MRHWLSAFWFRAPLAVLHVLWAGLIPFVEVEPRLFPLPESMAHAGVEEIKDGTLVQCIGASPVHITAGMVFALV